MKKRLLSLAMAVAMIFGSAAALPEGTFTHSTSIRVSAENAPTSGKCGENVYWSLDDKGVLTISGTGKMYDYDSWHSYSPFYQRDDIKSVVIKSGVTSIGDDVFFFCQNLTIISIPKSVTSIGNAAFNYCTRLKIITIPDNVTNIGARAFQFCESLTSITIPNGVAIINEGMFFSCKNLTSITIPGSVTSIGNEAFLYTQWLENQQKKNPLVIVNGILIDGTKCSGNVTIPSSVTSIGDNAFSYCSSLASVIIQNGATSIGAGAFQFCEILTNVTIPNSVTNIGKEAFCWCTGLISINISKSVKSIGNGAFDHCTSLTNVTIPNSVTSIGGSAFSGCRNLASVIIPKSVTEIGEKAFGYYSSLNQKYNDYLIMCYSGSEAEKYAKDNDFAFVLLDGPKATYSMETLGDSNKNQITAQIGREKTIKIHRAEFDNITYSLFDGVEVDGKTVDPTNYTAKSGSLNLTLKASYLSTLSVGDHTMKVLFKDGEYVSKLTVVKNTQPVRLAGAGRYATAAAISQAAFDKADTVILAYSMNYADALAGVPLAYQKNAPILLTNTKELDSAMLAEIKRLGAKKVILLGGEGAIGKEVETALVKGGIAKDNIKRIAGKSRFSTATAIASQLNEKPTDVFFVYYNGFADALSASTVAARKTAPIIYLTTNGEIDADTAKYLKSIKGSVKNAYVIGGEGVISNDMATKAAKALGLSKATRVAGADRFATCVEVNKQFAGDLNGDMICVATGMNFPDALAGGVYAAKNSAPLFLINGNSKTPNLNDAQKAYLKGKNAANITAFGGEGVVPDSHIADIAKNSI